MEIKHYSFVNQQKVLTIVFNKYIKDTKKGMNIENIQTFLCNLTISTSKGINSNCKQVYINSRALKHLYDKRPAEEFYSIIKHTFKIVKYPDKIYLNKDTKRGDYCFLKDIEEDTYICSLEIKTNETNSITHLEIVTVFRLRKKSYLDSYKLLWKWKDGTPSS